MAIRCAYAPPSWQTCTVSTPIAAPQMQSYFQCYSRLGSSISGTPKLDAHFPGSSMQIHISASPGLPAWERSILTKQRHTGVWYPFGVLKLAFCGSLTGIRGYLTLSEEHVGCFETLRTGIPTAKDSATKHSPPSAKARLCSRYAQTYPVSL